MRGLAAWRLLAIGALTVPCLVGCSLLLPPDFEGTFPEPSVLATYRSGAATIRLSDGSVVELPIVAPGSELEATMGSNVRWSNDDGWHVRVSGAGADDFFGAGAFLSIDRIAGGQHWTTGLGFDDRCIVDVDRADENGIAGAATCKGAAWYDALDQSYGFDGPKLLDEPRFDAEISFEARP